MIIKFMHVTVGEINGRVLVKSLFSMLMIVPEPEIITNIIARCT